MNTYHFIGIALTLLAFIGVSVFAARRVTNPAEFMSGGKSGSLIVAGTIMGTVVGGSSTIGTAQLAYVYGLSAWWFTLGAALGVLALVLGYLKKFRSSHMLTLVAVVANEYPGVTGILASVLSSAGMFVNILSQLLSAVAVIAVIAPSFGVMPALIITAVLMAAYVMTGGLAGAGLAGALKLALLYVTMGVCAVTVLSFTGGVTPLLKVLRTDGVTALGLFSRGLGKDLGAGLSLVFGILTTQTYGQAVMSAKSDRSAVKGALFSVALIPPIGVCGILVGLYMRTLPGTVALTALTDFILRFIPSGLAGVMLAALFFAVVGTGAGLALGISTIITKDVIEVKHEIPPAKELFLSRLIIIGVLTVGVVLADLLGSEMIQSFAYMSMGLRGAVMFVPMTAALFFKNRVSYRYAIAAIIAGPAMVLLFGVLNVLPIDPLFIGIGAALAIMLAGAFMRRQARTAK